MFPVGGDSPRAIYAGHQAGRHGGKYV